MGHWLGLLMVYRSFTQYWKEVLLPSLPVVVLRSPWILDELHDSARKAYLAGRASVRSKTKDRL